MITKSTTSSPMAVKNREIGLLGFREDELKLLLSGHQRRESVCWCKGELKEFKG
ncbi:hypothetical protein NC653_006027 [Populus alba x Populus x berolinensis]|uniref:Uncharacterized protein n=1 Tax=Populus alba x Populus x berolinensis TaxID=444605 RepID=A0AAD6RDK3_9ROSI|nr:hypothetical protein NC653_006027 [Populus alba x Populus x berolinensis]